MAKEAVVRRALFRPHGRVYAPISGESRTRQEFAEECDINSIMRRYEKTGVVSHINRASPRFLDLSEIPDFQTAMGFMAEARSAFMSLPARVRKEFDNDAAAFVSFADDPANRAQLEEWGLTAVKEPPAAPMRVEVVNPIPVAPEPPNGGQGGGK